MKPISVFTLGGNIDREVISVGLDEASSTKGDDQRDLYGNLGFAHQPSIVTLQTDIPLRVVQICQKVGNTLTDEDLQILKEQMIAQNLLGNLGQRVLVTGPAGKLVTIGRHASKWSHLSGRSVVLTGTDTIIGRDDGEIERQLHFSLQKLIYRPFPGVYIVRNGGHAPVYQWSEVYEGASKDAHDVEMIA